MSLHRLDTNQSRGDGDSGSLLSPVNYDDDASSIHSRSEQDTDSDDDELQLRARNSRELRAHDRIVLMEEEEMDRLVTDTRRQKERERRGSGLALPNPFKTIGRRLSAAGSSTEDLNAARSAVADKRKSRRARRQDKKKRLLEDAQNGEDGELMYEMEQGGMKDGSSTGESSDREDSEEMDRRRLGMVNASAKASKGRRWRRWILIHSLIGIGFAILVLVAWKLSKNKKTTGHAQQDFVSNGTALFAPTTIIISLDGFRADFLQRGITPRLNAMIKEGVSPKYMNPSFPSVTFPNHYTLATGLYPESHGLVGNSFWDPALQAEFYYTDPDRSLDPKWWGGEPFWVTAEQQGLRTAIHMWPGSEAHVLHVEPSFLDNYNGKETLDNKVARIFELLDKPGKEDETAAVADMRPQLIAAYVPDVDRDGHGYGPNSTEILSTIASADNMLDNIFKGLEERNLTDIVNIIVVSDHGMATTDVSRLIQLEDLMNDVSMIEHQDGWPLFGLRPKNPDDLRVMYDQLSEKAKSNPNIEVYLKDENMPERYHFSNNDRIAPLWVVPKTGWAIVTKEEFDIEKGIAEGLEYSPRGLHGYDHEHPLMRAIFIARGPAFPHPPNSKIEVFQNIEVYNILCDSVGMEPKPNNGTLRLPLKTIGFHEPGDEEEVPDDPVQSNPDRPTAPATPAGEDSSAESPKPPQPDPPQLEEPASPPPPPSDENEVWPDPEQEDGGDDDDDVGGIEGVWGWIKDTWGNIWNKITGSG